MYNFHFNILVFVILSVSEGSHLLNSEISQSHSPKYLLSLVAYFGNSLRMTYRHFIRGMGTHLPIWGKPLLVGRMSPNQV